MFARRLQSLGFGFAESEEIAMCRPISLRAALGGGCVEKSGDNVTEIVSTRIKEGFSLLLYY